MNLVKTGVAVIAITGAGYITFTALRQPARAAGTGTLDGGRTDRVTDVDGIIEIEQAPPWTPDPERMRQISEEYYRRHYTGDIKSELDRMIDENRAQVGPGGIYEGEKATPDDRQRLAEIECKRAQTYERCVPVTFDLRNCINSLSSGQEYVTTCRPAGRSGTATMRVVL